MKRPGFTLLEATVSLAIIATVGLGALEAFAADARTAVRARRATPAVAIASEQLARLQLADAHTLQALPDSLRHGRLLSDAIPYEWHATVSAVRDEPQLLALQVDVQWESGSYTLAARVFRPPMSSVR